MISADWLPLTDYSTKYKVSISTLRRRIKSEKINFRFDDGKYFIFDAPAESVFKDSHSHLTERPVTMQNEYSNKALPANESIDNLTTHPMVEAANRMLDELKKAYMLILQEKEEQILQLKEEIADLRTLARVLETENHRLNSLTQKNEGKSDDLPPTFY
jgi:hypothetical protein